MNLTAIQSAIQKSLKHTVTLHLTSGDKLPVEHPDYVAFPPSGKGLEFIVWQSAGGFTVTSADEVASVSVLPRRRQSTAV